MKKIFVFFILITVCGIVSAQEISMPLDTINRKDEPKLTAAIDVVYPYLWRGIRYYGDKVAFQGTINYAITEKLSVGVWGTTNFSDAADAYNEFDWSISYQISPIVSVMLSDYYWPATKKGNLADPSNYPRTPYFDYSEGSAQSLDFSILFDFSEKGFPLDFQWNTFVGGGDYKYDADGNVDGRAFSSYAEVGYTQSIAKLGVDIRPFIGAAVINGSYYGTDASGKAGFTFNNVGLNIAKEIKISENFSIPVFVRYTNNDYGVQKFDSDGNLTKTIRNFFSCGMTFTIR